MPSPTETSVQTEDRCLVLVTGAGRSGTSTIAGVLDRLGFRVPQPVLKENESNPRGFYESWWPVRFHNSLMKQANISPTDGRPVAPELMTGVLNEKVRAELTNWLAEQFDDSSLVMVKDPRASWAPLLWIEAAQSVGAEIGFVTMLRHPAEVIGSRQTYYAADQPPRLMRTFAIRHLCGWVNQNLTLERLNRERRRAFIRYTDLVSNWRPEVARMLTELDLTEIWTGKCEAQIDDFIEPSLRRHDPDWGRFDLPKTLIDMADRTWLALSTLAEQGGQDAAAKRSLDEIANQYAQMHADASAIALDISESMARKSLAQGRRQGRQQEAKKLAEARNQQLVHRGAKSIERTLRRLRSAIRP